MREHPTATVLTILLSPYEGPRFCIQTYSSGARRIRGHRPIAIATVLM